MSTYEAETWATHGLSATSRVDHWHDALGETHLLFDVAVPQPVRATFNAELTRRRFGELALVDCTVDPCSGHRGRQELAVDPGWAGVLVIGSGRERVSQAGREMVLGPGDCVVWDGDQAVDFEVLEPLRKRTLLLPRERVMGLGGSFPAHIAAGSAHSRLLAGYLDMLSRELDHLDGPACAAAANAALELMRAVVAPSAGGDLRTIVLPQIKRWIEARLHDPRLSPREIAATHAISVRTLHALFAATDESVSEFVKRRRLERARAELLDVPGVAITKVALRWGFPSAAHFSRCFRAEFGLSPRELRQDGMPSEAAGP
ncbi:helix-turn-helix domain-containing protein [Paraconexibacter antarcticus]|uniref:Helix-turn-helix domain-containing protein n=1 Tax=Paraconexibacter antarcticus TaxID=2949664 RepID=A0ABY5DLF0_9ACTN|nr:helix-turn-helix domain-containing protein [Paraconexibacter antarcticus]UTI62645.1 helix-turn-helix domain-containing protein [Paraconexibacter antarcticus]